MEAATSALVAAYILAVLRAIRSSAPSQQLLVLLSPLFTHSHTQAPGLLALLLLLLLLVLVRLEQAAGHPRLRARFRSEQRSNI